MKCRNYPYCNHGSPLVCLTAGATETPDDETNVWFASEEIAALERIFGTSPDMDRSPTIDEACTVIADTVTQGLARRGITLRIADSWQGIPSITFELMDYEKAKNAIHDMEPGLSKRQAEVLLRIAYDAHGVTWQLISSGVVSGIALNGLALKALKVHAGMTKDVRVPGLHLTLVRFYRWLSK